MTPYFKAFLAVITAVVLGVTLAVGLSGCATTQATKGSPVVSAFIFFDHCDRSFVEAALVHADGTITETDDPAEAKKLDAGVKDNNGRIVPVYVGVCEIGT